MIQTIWSPSHRTTCCFSSQKSLCHLVYSRRKIYFLVVRGSKCNILRIFSGENGAGNTFPFWNLDKSGYALRGIWQYGDVVLVATESSQKNSWLLGRIVETFLDGRGFVGQVKVHTKTAVFESPVDKLCVLIEGDCSIQGNMDNNSHRHLTDIRLDLSQLT